MPAAAVSEPDHGGKNRNSSSPGTLLGHTDSQLRPGVILMHYASSLCISGEEHETGITASVIQLSG